MIETVEKEVVAIKNELHQMLSITDSPDNKLVVYGALNNQIVNWWSEKSSKNNEIVTPQKSIVDIFGKKFKNCLNNICDWFGKTCDCSERPAHIFISNLVNIPATLLISIIFCGILKVSPYFASLGFIILYVMFPLFWSIIQTVKEATYRTDLAEGTYPNETREFIENVARLEVDPEFQTASARKYLYHVHKVLDERFAQAGLVYRNAVTQPKNEKETAIVELEEDRKFIGRSKDIDENHRAILLEDIQKSIEDYRRDIETITPSEERFLRESDQVKKQIDLIKTRADGMAAKQNSYRRLGEAIARVEKHSSNRARIASMKADLLAEARVEMGYLVQDVTSIHLALTEFQEKILPASEVFITTRLLTTTSSSTA